MERRPTGIADEVTAGEMKGDMEFKVCIFSAPVITMRTFEGFLAGVVSHVTDQSVLPEIGKQTYLSE